MVLLGIIRSLNAQVTPILYSGGWKINDQHPFTCITHANLASPKRFLITNTSLDDGTPVKFKIYDDGMVSTAILPEGGGMIVDTKSLGIAQLGAGESFQGNWKILGSDGAMFHQVPWIAFPNQAERVLIGVFDQPVEFTLNIHKSNRCSNGLALIYVDGSPVVDMSNQPLHFLEGSGITGVGQKIEIKFTGACTKNNSFSGSLRIAQ